MTARVDPRAKPVPPAWAREIAPWCDHMAATGMSPNTVRSRRDHLQRASRAILVGPWETETADLIAWAADQDWAAETRRNVYASLRGFFRWGVLSGRAHVDPTLALPRPKAGFPSPRPAPERLVDAAMQHTDTRTRLILRLAIELGLRRAEIAHIHAQDIWEDLAGWSLTVHGKGNKDRDIPLPADIAFIIRNTCSNGWLFPSDRHPSGHLTPQYVGVLASRALPPPWTLHTLRHACATGVYNDTRDLLLVQQLLGHSNVATTQRYVQIPDTALREAIVKRGRRRAAPHGRNKQTPPASRTETTHDPWLREQTQGQ